MLGGWQGTPLPGGGQSRREGERQAAVHGQRRGRGLAGALPSKGLWLHLRKEEFCMAGKYCPGIPVFTSKGLCLVPRCPGEAERGTCVYFACTPLLQEATMVVCADDGTYAVQIGHDQKLARYANRCMKERLAFLPMTMDTFARWHTEALHHGCL